VGLVLADRVANVRARANDLGQAGGGGADREKVVEEPDDLEAEVAGAGDGSAEVTTLATRADDQEAVD
jgi:hypothetical protein